MAQHSHPKAQSENFIISGLKTVARKLWGDFQSKEEVFRFLHLAVIFGLLIGVYWTLRPIKDAIFMGLVGDMIPWAKLLSFAVGFPIVMLYGYLVDKYPRQRVFYAFSIIYALGMFAFMFQFSDPVVGLANKTPDVWRISGWLWYVFVESFGTIMVTLFWAFTSDTTRPDVAARAFPLIGFFGQLGNIFGPMFLQAKKLGFATSAPIPGICGGLTLLTGAAFWLFMKVTPPQALRGYQDEEKQAHAETEPSFWEGLNLVLTQGYLMGLFFIIASYEVIVTIFDYHFKSSAYVYFQGDTNAVGAYLSDYASWTGIVALACIALGVNNIQRALGMLPSLLTTPALIMIAMATLKLFPSQLPVAFWIMVLSKALNYALNQPTLKQLYIPTTRDTKYKAQAWVEMFGSRSSKATGSLLNLTKTLFSTIGGFLMMTSVVSAGLMMGWVLFAMFVSKKYNKAMANKEVVC